MLRRLAKAEARHRIFVGHFPTQRRHASSHTKSFIGDFADTLAARQPVFRVPSGSVRILRQPAEFYRSLLDLIANAERRIFLSSLYIGKDETELISALVKRLTEQQDLRLIVLLDLNRSTRASPDSTIRLLTPLLRQFEDRVHISMFRSPYLRGPLSKIVPPRFNEGWGTWHAKIYGADDDVIISGANLNKSYFSNRQDRYICFHGLKSFAQYCFDFIETAAKFSYKLLPNRRRSTSEGSINDLIPSSQGDYIIEWPISDTHPHYFNHIAQNAFSSLQKSYRERNLRMEGESNENVLLVPIIQAGQFNIKEEEWVFQELFSHLKRFPNVVRPILDLTSGYFSLYKPYQDLILNTPNVNCRIVAASPMANGFYGSKGISGRIPEGYTFFEKNFMSAVYKAGRNWQAGPDTKEGHGVSLSEWERPGWTYHAKGIWLSSTSESLPFLTLFGSTNLNSRSAHIDTELSFMMLIPPEEQATSAVNTLASGVLPGACTGDGVLSLRQNLALELECIRSNASDWKGASRRVRWLTKFITWLLKGML